MNSPQPPPQCDIIIPIHNSLGYVQECLASILVYTQAGAYRLIIVDDASDSHTHRYLSRLAADILSRLLSIATLKIWASSNPAIWASLSAVLPSWFWSTAM